MDMQQAPQGQADSGEEPYIALMKQARDLIDQAITAAGGEEKSESQQGGDMQSQRADIAKQVFGGGGY